MTHLPHTATDYASLIEGLRVRKAELGLSNQEMDRLMGFTAGYYDKVLGPSSKKGLSRMVLETLMEVLAIDLVIVGNGEKALRMEGRYEERIASHVRQTGRVSKERIAEARPALEKLIRTEMASVGGLARSASLTGKQRSEIASIGGFAKAAKRGKPLKPIDQPCPRGRRKRSA